MNELRFVFLILSVLVLFIVFMLMLSTESHLKYSRYCAKYYGFWSFFSAMFWSFVLPKKYFQLSLIFQKLPDLEQVAAIDVVCRNVLNGNKDFNLRFNDYRMEFHKNNKAIATIVTHDNSFGIMDDDMDYNIILHPRTIRLIEGTKNFIAEQKKK